MVDQRKRGGALVGAGGHISSHCWSDTLHNPLHMINHLNGALTDNIYKYIQIHNALHFRIG